jgi:hypothetical protein
LALVVVVGSSGILFGAWAWTYNQTQAVGSGSPSAPYSCGGLPFDLSTVPLQPRAEQGSDGAAQALRDSVARLSSILPEAGWWRLSAPAGVLFVADSGKQVAPYVFVHLLHFGADWLPLAYGDCELAQAARGGAILVPFDWWTARPVDSSGWMFEISLVKGPEFGIPVGTSVWYDQARVVVTVWGCPSFRPDIFDVLSGRAITSIDSWKLLLAESLGDRQLLAGPAWRTRSPDLLPLGGPTSP